MRTVRSSFSIILLAFLVVPGWLRPARTDAMPAPVLKWQGGGCNGDYCETGWYASPAVADLNGDGRAEVIGAAYSVFVVEGETGELVWRTPAGTDLSQPGVGGVGRTWPGVAVADVDGQGGLEIITAHADGVLSVYDGQGYFKPGWPQQPTPGQELRSLAVADLEGDGDLEILVAATQQDMQWHVFEHDGREREGDWPQHAPDSSTNGYTSGCFNQNIAAGDLDGDGRAEVIGSNDTHYLAAFEDDGRQLPASSIYGANPDGSPKVWSRVGVHVDHYVDLRGYALCGTEHRPNFAHAAPAIADLDGNGVLEVIVVGNVYDCGAANYQSLYEIPYILEGNRTRWHAGGYDWTTLPLPDALAGPLSEDYEVIENHAPNPVPADLDGDGRMEILYPSYDGRLHAYWLDETEHGSWPFSVYQSGEGLLRFASEPVVADLDGDGLAEVILASWTEHGSGQPGRLHVLNHLGQPLHEIDLPPASESAGWNGSLAAPTLANIDDDPDLEVVLNTAHTGLVAYDLPQTAEARVLWGTGRGNFQRSGSYIEGALHPVGHGVDHPITRPGDPLHYTVWLDSSGGTAAGVRVTIELPAEIRYAGNLFSSSGSAALIGATITWQGDVPAVGVEISYDAQVDENALPSQVIVNTAVVEDAQGRTWELPAVTVVEGRGIYFPLALK